MAYLGDPEQDFKNYFKDQKCLMCKRYLTQVMGIYNASPNGYRRMRQEYDFMMAMGGFCGRECKQEYDDLQGNPLPRRIKKII